MRRRRHIQRATGDRQTHDTTFICVYCENLSIRLHFFTQFFFHAFSKTAIRMTISFERTRRRRRHPSFLSFLNKRVVRTPFLYYNTCERAPGYKSQLPFTKTLTLMAFLILQKTNQCTCAGGIRRAETMMQKNAKIFR